MSDETGLERARSRFPTTRWSRILTPEGDHEARKAAWTELARTYWKPVFAYVRTRWARTDEEALDGAQEFFLWMMSRDFLERADPARGRFRGLVKVALSNFLRDLERKRRTLRRGGERTFLSFGAGGGDGERELPVLDPADTRGKSPEDVLDDVWRAEVLARATRALEDELCGQGKELTFRVFQEYFLSDEDEVEYSALAARHGIKASDVSNHLQAAKRRFRAVLKATVADTVTDRDELEGELAWLFGKGTG